jgi:MerR family transcriptional regulator/heat shock protein HspR
MNDRPIYMISVAAELVGMHPQTLRMYEQKGLIRPKRTPGGTRLYSEADVERLRIVQRLTTELGLNLAGVELVLRLEDELRKAHARIDRLERELRTEVQNVHKQYRRDLVVYREERTPERRNA